MGIDYTSSTDTSIAAMPCEARSKVPNNSGWSRFNATAVNVTQHPPLQGRLSPILVSHPLKLHTIFSARGFLSTHLDFKGQSQGIYEWCRVMVLRISCFWYALVSLCGNKNTRPRFDHCWLAVPGDLGVVQPSNGEPIVPQVARGLKHG